MKIKIEVITRIDIGYSQAEREAVFDALRLKGYSITYASPKMKDFRQVGNLSRVIADRVEKSKSSEAIP